MGQTAGGNSQTREQINKIELITAGAQLPLHDMGGSLCIQGITQGNE